MQGALALRNGVLYVGRHEISAHVRPYDLDGTALAPGFTFRGLHGGPARLVGLDVDPDHRVWIADAAAPGVRAFHLLGREVGGFGAHDSGFDARGSLRDLADVVVEERQGELEFLVALLGEKRHAVQLFGEDGRWMASLRSEGQVERPFRGVRRVARHGSTIFVCESGAGRIQVFRRGEFEFSFRLPARRGGQFEPRAIQPLSDGRLVVACGGDASALFLLDRGGRLLRVLAELGEDTGKVLDPNDLAVEEGSADGRTRLAVIDRDAERVQVFTLEGECRGALSALPGEA